MTFRRVETIAEGWTRSKPYACVGTPEQKRKGSRDAKKRMIDEEGQIEDLRMVLERERKMRARELDKKFERLSDQRMEEDDSDIVSEEEESDMIGLVCKIAKK